jgi:hypothetical protein
MVFGFAALGSVKTCSFGCGKPKAWLNTRNANCEPPLHMAGVANLASATQKRSKLQRLGAPWRVRGQKYNFVITTLQQSYNNVTTTL